ncbi:MAG: GtrA family protein [Candidatus Cloacimonadota bacterium]|nr:GtrA family protein [Candidatus Cloacimonadota bacterium]
MNNFSIKNLGRKILIEKSRNHKIEFIQSTLLGTFATGIEVALIYFFTHYLGVKPVASAGISYILYSVIVYFVSVRFIFHHRIFKNKILEYLIFGSVGIVGMFIYTFFVSTFMNLGFHYMIASIIAGPLVYIWNFFLRKYLLFSNDIIKYFRKYRFDLDS